MAQLSEVYLSLCRRAAEAGWAVVLRAEGTTVLTVDVQRQDGSCSSAASYERCIELLAELDREPEPAVAKIAVGLGSTVIARCNACAKELVACTLAEYWASTRGSDALRHCAGCGKRWRLPEIGSTLTVGGTQHGRADER